MGKKILKILMAFGILIVIGIIISVWLVWKRPLKVDAAFSRLALKKHGFETTELKTPDGRMTVWQGGSGPCMVMLHGAGDQAGAWARTAPAFVGAYRVVIPDLPGHWNSDPTHGPLGIDQLLAGLESVMSSVCSGNDNVVVGNSMGAWVAMVYARNAPTRVTRLVLVNGGAVRQDNPAVNIFPANREEASETMAALMGPATPPLPGFVLDDVVRHAREGPAGRLAGRLAEATEAIEPFLLDGRLDEVPVQTELVWGDSDGLFTLDYAQRLLDGLPRARLHPVAGCGHVPHRECPDRFAEVLLEALAMPPEEISPQEPLQ